MNFSDIFWKLLLTKEDYDHENVILRSDIKFRKYLSLKGQEGYKGAKDGILDIVLSYLKSELNSNLRYLVVMGWDYLSKEKKEDRWFVAAQITEDDTRIAYRFEGNKIKEKPTIPKNGESICKYLELTNKIKYSIFEFVSKDAYKKRFICINYKISDKNNITIQDDGHIVTFLVEGNIKNKGDINLRKFTFRTNHPAQSNFSDCLKEIFDTSIQIEKINKLKLLILSHIHYIKPGHNEVLCHYFPIRLTYKNSKIPEVIAIITSITNGPINNLEVFQKAILLVESKFLQVANEKRFSESLNQSLKSAIAAIMSRNGSHNLGSHIISAISNEYNELSDDQLFYEYIQQRMDFIATITTEFPDWSYPVWFLRDLMLRFYMQRHLLNYIAESEGLNAFEFQPVNGRFPDPPKLLIEIRKNGFDEPIIEECIQNREALEHDLQIAIPGGIIGYQAFYTILENIIRNSAKHDWATLSPQKKKTTGNLVITIEYADNIEEDILKFRIWNNVTDLFSGKQLSESDPLFHRLPRKNGEEIILDESDTENFEKLPLHQQNNCRLCKSFIDKNTGELLKENWGLAEMKISTGYLNKKTIAEIGAEGAQILFSSFNGQDAESNNIKKTGIIEAIPVKDADPETSEVVYRLGYQFAIPKPKEILIEDFPSGGIDKHVLARFKKHNIYFTSEESPGDRDFEFVILFDNGKNKLIQDFKDYCLNGDEEILEKIKRQIERYPFRLFVVADDLVINHTHPFLAKRVVLLKFEDKIFGEKTVNEFLKSTLHHNTLDEKITQFKLWLYAKWIRNLSHCRGLDKTAFKMLINLSGKPASTMDRTFEIILKKYQSAILNRLAEISSCNINEDIINSLKKITFNDFLKHHKKYSPKEDLVRSWMSLAQIKDQQIKKELITIVDDYFHVIDRVYNRYKEDIETLPVIFTARNGKNIQIKLHENLAELLNVEVYNDENRFEDDIKQAEKPSPKIISYNRHKLISTSLKDRKENVLYDEALSGAQVYFSLLSQMPDDVYLQQKIILQLLENALCRMLVIDERVAQYVNKFKERIRDKFYGANIHVPIAVRKSRSDEPIVFLPDKTIEEIDEDEMVTLNEIPAEEFDSLIIHQGVLDKLIGGDKNSISHYMNSTIKNSIPFVIITSGRGSPSNLPEDTKFLAFSNIESFLLGDYHEKFLLTQMVMKTLVNPAGA